MFTIKGYNVMHIPQVNEIPPKKGSFGVHYTTTKEGD